MIEPEDRWRLLLGRERDRLGTGGRRAGLAHDEGSASRLGGGSDLPSSRPGSGPTSSGPSFGATLMEQVLGRAAAAAGRSAALLEVEPEQVTPSVELLEQVLSLKGSLPEAKLTRLREAGRQGGR